MLGGVPEGVAGAVDPAARSARRIKNPFRRHSQRRSASQYPFRLVGGVRANAESVATASAEIAQGNTDLSSRTEQASRRIADIIGLIDGVAFQT
ncbi:hypothetical protein L7A49_32785, partial [Achromobacter xylosoxidans]|nr:hypothetical protein [Achromobacter xylosoxidans]